MTRSYPLLLLPGLALFLGGCFSTESIIAKRREITIERFYATYPEAFDATVAVLQDRGFTIEELDRRSGLIRAKKHEELSLDTLKREFSGIFSGDAEDRLNDGSTYMVSCVVTPDGEHTEIRAMIQKEPPSGTRGLKEWAQILATFINKESDSDDDDDDLETQNVYKPEIYRALFEEIRVEVERRKHAGLSPGSGAQEGGTG